MPRITCLIVSLLVLATDGAGAGQRGIGGIKRLHGHRQDIQRYAVIIGISKYKNSDTIAPLKYATADAKAFYDFIRTPVGGGFEEQNIRLLLDEQATVKNVRSALGTFLKKAVADDMVYIYFAGHGAPEPKNPSNLYFLTYEADVDDLFSTSLPMDQITYILKKHIFAKRVVVLTDACHSAGIGGDLGGTRGGENRINDFVRQLAKTRPGRAVITGSRTGEYSQEGTRWGGGHGVFTHYWLQALEGSADVNADGIVTLGEAFDYTSRKVARDTQNNQHPDTLGNFDNDMPLAIHDPTRYEKMLARERQDIAKLEKKVADLEKKRRKISSKKKEFARLARRKGELKKRLAALKDEDKRVDCPADMVRIHNIFCIDRYEYPNKAGAEPLTEVSFEEAAEMCAKQGKRVCSLDEWVAACSGDTGWPYPYGPDYAPGQCNDNRSGRKTKTRSAEFERCRNKAGVFDLSGNVYEWVVRAPGAEEQAIIGGSFDDSAADVSCNAHDSSEIENSSEYVGFRCCK